MMECSPRVCYSATPAGFGIKASGDAKAIMSASIYDTQMLAHAGYVNVLCFVQLVLFSSVGLIMSV